MGEFVAIAVVLSLIIGATFLVILVRAGNAQRVTKNVAEEDMVNRVKITLTPDKATALAKQLTDAAKKQLPCVIDLYEKDNRLVRITVV
jgi:hypothetical protein